MKESWTIPEDHGQGGLWFCWKDYTGEPCAFMLSDIHGMMTLGGKHMLILSNGNSVQVPEAVRDSFAQFIGWKKESMVLT